MRNVDKVVRLDFRGVEIGALWFAFLDSSNVTHMDAATRNALIALYKRIQLAIKMQTGNDPNDSEFGDF